MKIVACISFYNEEEFLPLCLRSLKENGINRIIAIDGRYKEYPEKSEYSTDKSKDILKSFGAEVYLAGGLTETEKRNLFFHYIENEDWILIIDADEFLSEQFTELNKEVIGYRLNIHRFNLPPAEDLRLLRNQKGLSIQYCHNAIFLNNSLIIKEKIPLLNSPILYHLTDLKKRERKEKKGKYLKELWDNEKNFRKEVGL